MIGTLCPINNKILSNNFRIDSLSSFLSTLVCEALSSVNSSFLLSLLFLHFKNAIEKNWPAQCRRGRFDPRKIPWRRKWQPTPVLLLGIIP